MAFEKGKSGNPGGRPKNEKGVVALAQANCREAIYRLIELMKDDDKRISMEACKVLLDRGYGKPHQSVEHTGELEITNFVLYGVEEVESADEWQQQNSHAIQ